jgi:hypothetical protein
VSVSYRTFHHRGRDYHVRYYPRHYRGWLRYCWFPRYRCYGYLSPDDNAWYFYSPQNEGFMPVEYMNTFTPPPVDGPTVPIPTEDGTQQLPPGATPLQPGMVPPGP